MIFISKLLSVEYDFNRVDFFALDGEEEVEVILEMDNDVELDRQELVDFCDKVIEEEVSLWFEIKEDEEKDEKIISMRTEEGTAGSLFIHLPIGQYVNLD